MDITQEINEVIRRRRSVYPKQFTGETIDDQIVWQMLENARWAPNHGRTEPWRFVVFAGTAGIDRLIQIQEEVYRAHTPAESQDEGKLEKLAANARQCSHIIALGMARQASGKIPEIEEVAAVACAVQNMYLTATAYQVGAYWGSGGITYYEAAKPYFGLGTQDKLLGFFYIGKIGAEIPDSTRTALDTRVQWIGGMKS